MLFLYNYLILHFLNLADTFSTNKIDQCSDLDYGTLMTFSKNLIDRMMMQHIQLRI